jgi:mersacidin/lichenicidin family type 2 lantibiotic
MNREDIVRAWKDPNYRSTLSKEQLAELPINPVGTFELTEAELAEVAGGTTGTCGTGGLPPRDCFASQTTCNEACDL